MASLLYNGFNDEAFAAVRTMLEIEFQLSAIRNKPEIMERLVRDNEIFRKRRMRNLLKHKVRLPDNFQESDVQAEIERLEAEQLISGKEALQKKEVAEIGGCLKDYETLYSYLSDVDHVSPIGLAEYVEVHPTRKIANLRYGTTPFPIPYAFLWNSSILLKSLALVCIILNKSLPGEYSDLDKRHSDLWQKYFSNTL